MALTAQATTQMRKFGITRFWIINKPNRLITERGLPKRTIVWRKTIVCRKLNVFVIVYLLDIISIASIKTTSSTPERKRSNLLFDIWKKFRFAQNLVWSIWQLDVFILYTFFILSAKMSYFHCMCYNKGNITIILNDAFKNTYQNTRHKE